jgi:hypothetical protein
MGELQGIVRSRSTPTRSRSSSDLASQSSTTSVSSGAACEASDDVLEGIAHALQLDDAERAHKACAGH